MAQERLKYNPDYAVMPGKTVQDTMIRLGYTQKEFAERLDTTVQSLNRIFNEAQPITHEMACKLEMVTGTPANFWNNREAIYRERIAKINEKKQFEKDIDWLKSIPVKDLQKRGYILNSDDKVEQLRSTLQFFGVSSVKAWNEVWKYPQVAARRSECFKSHPGSASAWIRIGELKAQNIQCNPFDRQAFVNALREIRSLTKQTIDCSWPNAVSLCAKSGVALVAVKELKQVPWNGATKWITPDKAMILLTIRGKYEDLFWFSFFHEAGHILNDGKKNLFINNNNNNDEIEIRANVFAADFLIPAKYNKDIESATSHSDIEKIATEIDIDPGIVAGRYRFLTKKHSFFKDLTRKLEWAE